MDTKFSVALHILIMFSETTEKLTSEKIAKSVNTNPSHIRKIITFLKKANLLTRQKGTFEYSLVKDKSVLNLFDIYKAVNPDKLLYTHQNSNKNCPVGHSINKVLDPIIIEAEKELENYLSKIFLLDVIEKIRKEITENN
ncbi:Rrf2 family transcriptional regulator [Fusobacterium sp.]|uniref:Rrf2 family transcriptional regulator n=1 Tax=Fusobacterium sp. TaxID=68766 RepID=UPI0025BFA4FF|nr:Rrf2 family transcriptional regulator [Fusobacterium sp.]MCI5724844.1 Rrf2 family transcriptional regulator [Fusobacterium sp.]MCI7223166.1 Rrf2 family transcriptional regulator [Fusobacterium sp.]